MSYPGDALSLADGPSHGRDQRAPTGAGAPVGLPQEDLLRARFYEVLALLLAAPPGAHLLDRLAGLEGDDATPLGSALADLASLAAITSSDQAAREYHDLFIGVTRGELVPYASYYMTGSLQGPVLADLRDELTRLGIARRPEVAEPEDSLASVCEIMRALIEGAFGPPADLAEQHQFFRRYLAPWAPRLFADLETARAARFYRAVGALGRIFIDIEREALDLGAPQAGAAG